MGVHGNLSPLKPPVQKAPRAGFQVSYKKKNLVDSNLMERLCRPSASLTIITEKLYHKALQVESIPLLQTPQFLLNQIHKWDVCFWEASISILLFLFP